MLFFLFSVCVCVSVDFCLCVSVCLGLSLAQLPFYQTLDAAVCVCVRLSVCLSVCRYWSYSTIMFQGQTYRKKSRSKVQEFFFKKNVLEDGVLRVERSLVLGGITHEALLA